MNKKARKRVMLEIKHKSERDIESAKKMLYGAFRCSGKTSALYKKYKIPLVTEFKIDEEESE